MTSPVEHNRRAWDRRAERRQRFARPIDAETLNGAPMIDPWAAEEGVAGQRVLCLGAGGGRQAPLYARAGGNVTVVDISDAQLDHDRKAAKELGLPITAVRASIDELSALPEAGFDLVVQPVSTCYVPEVRTVYEQVARVIRPGGLYISQHKQPVSLQAGTQRSARGYELLVPQDQHGPLPEVTGSPHREPGTREFLHTWEQLVGGLCRAGFTLEDLHEPSHGDPAARPGSFADRCRYAPPYVRLKARRRADPQPSPPSTGPIITA